MIKLLANMTAAMYVIGNEYWIFRCPTNGSRNGSDWRAEMVGYAPNDYASAAVTFHEFYGMPTFTA